MENLIVMEVWKVGDDLYGRTRSDVAPRELAQRYRAAYDLPGKAAHYFCVTDDPGIRRADIVRFCFHHFRGSTRTINVDLSQVFLRRDTQERLWTWDE